MRVPNSQLTTIFWPIISITTVFFARYQFTANPIGTLCQGCLVHFILPVGYETYEITQELWQTKYVFQALYKLLQITKINFVKLSG